MELTAKRTGDGVTLLFFYSAHHHAEVEGFDDHSDPLGLQDLHHAISDLSRETFLDLQPAGEGIDDPRNFGKSDDFAFRNIGDVRLSVKRQKVMLAHRENLDVPDDDHLAGFFIEEGASDDFLEVLFVPRGQELHRRRVALGSPSQTLAIGVFPELIQDIPDIL